LHLTGAMRATILTALALAACTETTATMPDQAPGVPTKADDPSFAVSGVEGWYLIGDAVTPGEDDLQVAIDATTPVQVVDLWLDREFAARGTASAGHVDIAVDIADLPPGEHEILLAADDAQFAFAQIFFQRSHPLYFVVSNDWDTTDHTDAAIERQERLHDRHPSLLITHFVGPYTFTDPALAASRRTFLVDWLTAIRDTRGDEIGLHIHPWCHFVESAGVTCKTSHSFAFPDGDASGRTIFLGSYTQSEFEALLDHAIDLFVAGGLGQPTSFRAGGWTLEPQTMRALASRGFVADTSAANWERMEEWEDHAGAELYPWNREHWQPIDELSQPYYPSTTDLLATSSPRVSTLEVPDNGLLVDYVSGAEMISMFDANLGAGALTSPRAFSIGYHPISFSETFFQRIDQALAHIDQHLAADDLGPAVYARLSDMPAVWPAD
jgi:hypothetical protein